MTLDKNKMWRRGQWSYKSCIFFEDDRWWHYYRDEEVGLYISKPLAQLELETLEKAADQLQEYFPWKGELLEALRNFELSTQEHHASMLGHLRLLTKKVEDLVLAPPISPLIPTDQWEIHNVKDPRVPQTLFQVSFLVDAATQKRY